MKNKRKHTKFYNSFFIVSISTYLVIGRSPLDLSYKITKAISQFGVHLTRRFHHNQPYNPNFTFTSSIPIQLLFPRRLTRKLKTLMNNRNFRFPHFNFLASKSEIQTCSREIFTHNFAQHNFR